MFNERNFFMKQRRVVVTGIGTLNPLGNNIEEYFTNLTQGVSGAGPITHFDPSNFKTKFACELKGYDPNNFFDRKEVRKYDLYTQYALIAAEQAIKDSGLDLETIDKDMAGVIWASGIGGLETFYQEVKSYVEGGEIPRYSPFFIPKMIADMGAGQISMKYGFRMRVVEQRDDRCDDLHPSGTCRHHYDRWLGSRYQPSRSRGIQLHAGPFDPQ